MQLSIVTTLYYSLPFLRRFIDEMTEIVNELGIEEYEIVFVNDGSPDNSLDFLIEERKQNNKIRIVDLSRNFGHHYALQAGINFASGEYIYIVDNDLETPSSFLKNCYDRIKENSELDLVYGVQDCRKGHFIEKIGGQLFWKTFNWLSSSHTPANILTECIMTKKFAHELLRLNDANLFLGGMIHWIGLNKEELVVKKGQREGKSTYTFRKRFQLMIQAVTSFSGKPLELLFYLGLFITLCSIIFLIYLIVKKIVLGDAISIGWTSLVGINILSLGLISTFMGLIGLYIFRIYRQVQGRPNYIIKKIY